MIRYCAVGSLVGDAWGKLPKVVALCREFEVKLIAGTYALPVWRWAQEHVEGADFEIEHVVPDPDEHEHPYCPGKGYIALRQAWLDMRERFGDSVIETEGRMTLKLEPLRFRGIEVHDGGHIAVQPFTRHCWKNLGDLVFKARFSRPVKVLGLPAEKPKGKNPGRWEFLHDADFADQVQAVASAAGFVGVLSCWGNVAEMLGKKQIIVSFTHDVPNENPRAVKLFQPGLSRLQNTIRELGF